MTTRPLKFPLAAAVTAVLALGLAACGGGNGEAPPVQGGSVVDPAAPVVTITNNISAEVATGAITFTFSFNRDVGTSFSADDVAVTGGTKGAFNRTSGTSATLVVNPDADVSGTVQVSVAANSVTAATGTGNAATSASKAFNTVLRTVLVSFDETTAPVLTGFGGAEDATVVADPTNAANKVGRVVKSATAELWAGTTVSVCPNQAIARLPFSSTLKRMSVRVWSPVAGVPVRLKVEDASDNTKAVETEAITSVASAWQTLTFDFNVPAAGTAALNLAYTYNKASIFFNFGTAGSVTGARTYYFDDVAFQGSSFSAACAAPPPSGAGTVIANFDDVNPPTAGFEGAEGSAVENGPAGGGSGRSFKVLRSGGQVFALGIIETTVPITATRRTISAQVYSPTAGIPMVMKLEGPAAANTGDVAANEPVVVGWQTLTWTFTTANPAATYNKIVLLPNLGTVDAAPGKAYYFDAITLADGAPVSSGPLTFSTGFGGGNRTVEGGEFGGFSGSNLDGFNCNGDPANCGSGGTFVPAGTAADSFFFYYYQTTTPATALYMGIFVQAPGVTGGFSPAADTAGVQVGSQTTLKFKLGQNAEWFGTATNNFMIVMDLGKRFTVGGDTACRLQLRRVVTPTAAGATDYAIPLSSFSLVQNCGGAATSVAQALAASPISQISFQGVGGSIALSDGARTSGANLTVADGGGRYPTALSLVGGIKID
jgi:hypothetical protein